MHGGLTQRDSVSEQIREEDTRFVATRTIPCVRARKSAREKRSPVIAVAFRGTVPLARIPRSGDRETQLHLHRPTYRENLSRGSNLPLA